MAHLHLDPIGGLAGNLMLGALVELGASLAQIDSDMRELGLDGFKILQEKVQMGAISATCVSVVVPEQPPQPERHLSEIRAIVNAPSIKVGRGAAGQGASPFLPTRVRERAMRTFEALARAEATVHGTTPEEVHFHEVGAVDALVDIVGTALALEALSIDTVSATPPPLGQGLGRSAHGVIPLPAPATLELLRGTRLNQSAVQGEMTTPTGAALLRALVGEPLGSMPAMELQTIGHGAGHARWPDRPNVLRALYGSLQAPRGEEDAALFSESRPGEAVLSRHQRRLELSAQVDDLPPEQAAYCVERLLEAGALDATITPILMKKGRPGLLITAQLREESLAALEAILLRESGSLGVRVTTIWRLELEREQREVETEYGRLSLKLGWFEGKLNSVSPEYEACAAAARRAGVPLSQVYEAARAALPASLPEEARVGSGRGLSEAADDSTL